MAQTLFTLGFATTNSPWAYQHTLGISTGDIQAWWKNNLPALKQQLQNLPGGAATPAKPLSPPPGYMTPQPQDNSSNVLLVSVLLVGGGLAAYYFYKKSKDAKGKKASA